MTRDPDQGPEPAADDDGALARGDATAASDELGARVAEATALLESLRDDYASLAAIEPALRRRFLTAAGQVARPGPWARRELAKAARRRRRDAQRAADEAALAATGIRKKRAEPVFQTPQLAPPVAAGDDIAAARATDSKTAAAPQAAEAKTAAAPRAAAPNTVGDERSCYVCKARFRELHHFYDQMCPACAALNWQKRHQTADLRGRVALVTGARVKIGYQAAILLLRAGARVVVTTRFPRDAAARYAREPDAAAWLDRLSIYGIDLRHTPSVEALCQHLGGALDRLDVIINNACQTVRRPAGFYAHLIADEHRPLAELPAAAQRMLEPYEAMRAGRALTRPGREPAGLHAPAALSQLELTREDRERSLRLFPAGELDADLQQVDLRGHNSWRARLHEVSAVELLEVQLVNAVAPFILNARLKALMTREPSADKHIVNVSAMEGQFYRRFKTDKHPHTNMAKAALNMMTRTSAIDYVADGIHMNSVDTGWVTDEDPAEIAALKVKVHRFHPPLDIVDGAARICDPVLDGHNTGTHAWGQFFKDYRATDW